MTKWNLFNEGSVAQHKKINKSNLAHAHNEEKQPHDHLDRHRNNI